MTPEQNRKQAGYRYVTYFRMRMRISNGVLRLYEDRRFWRKQVAKFARSTWHEAIVDGNNNAVRVAVYDPPLQEGPPYPLFPEQEPERRRPDAPMMREILAGGGPFTDDELAEHRARP